LSQIKELRSKLNKYSDAVYTEKLNGSDLSDVADSGNINSDTPAKVEVKKEVHSSSLGARFKKNHGSKGVRSFSTKSFCRNVNDLAKRGDLRNNRFSAYLAGLIEADGSIAVHDKNTKAQKYRPKIIVVFSLADKPLAERLAFITQAGTVYQQKAGAGYLL